MRQRDHAVSWQYLAEMDDARRVVEQMVEAGFPVPRIVWRARTLYRAIYRRELVRYRNAATD